MKFSVTSPSDPLCRSGVYVGGIGSGGFEVRPDGRFDRNQISNDWHSERDLDMLFLHDSGSQRRVLRFGGLNGSESCVDGVSKIDYNGNFPDVTLGFKEADTSIRFRSFFSPGNTADSTLPACSIRVKGKGRLCLLLAVPPSTEYCSKNNQAVFTDTNGAVGFYSKTGQFYCCRRSNATVLLHWYIASDWFKPIATGIAEHASYAIVTWTGTYDDELILAWHYPQWIDSTKIPLHHAYTNRFKSCDEVLTYVRRNHKSLLKKSAAFSDTVKTAAAPAFIKEAYTAQLSTFAKQSRYTAEHDFGVWEGACCCCCMQTTDVSYYGSWLYYNLFPELERAGMRATTRFQNKDGWIPHGFPATFSKIDEYRRKDMNMQYVLMAYRNWHGWHDKTFLKEIYPHVKLAMNGAMAWDTNGDGIPEVEPSAQTFDAWEFSGTSIYLATLWLAALQAAASMAKLMDDKQSHKKWLSLIAGVRKTIMTKFWNGEYFMLAVTDTGNDDCCLIDALSGDWYSRMVGLGGILEDTYVRAHLKACIKYNRKKIDHSYMKEYIVPGEEGFCMINGGYRVDKRLFFQQYEPWTGLEYAFGLHCLLLGMKTEGLRAIRDVYTRLANCGHHWNHRECGGEYFRPMSIGAAWELITKRK